MKEVFEFLVQTGMDQIELIAEPKEKALACAALATAVAKSGLLMPMITLEGQTACLTNVEPEPIKETGKKKAAGKKKVEAKDVLKPEAAKIEAPAPIVEEQIETPQEPVETDEWTDETCTERAEELTMLNQYVEAWGEDYVYVDCLTAFTEGAFSGGENVRPSNIQGFLVYLQQLAEQFAN